MAVKTRSNTKKNIQKTNNQVTTVNGVDFIWSETAEPHVSRRREILKKYPQIVKLFGPEPLTFVIVSCIVVFQVYMASILQNSNWLTIIIASYIIGGTLNHSLQLAAHELSHSLCFGVAWADKLVGILANFPTGMPSAITFIKYHMEHHQWQGSDHIDTDIPCEFELNTFNTPFKKFIWCILQPFFYALRPVILNPKKPDLWVVLNAISVILFDYWIYTTYSGKALAYLIIGTFLGLGFHPLAGHFIAEHYVFQSETQETYSYYGYLNWLMFNVGYHNEHHDFPKIAWSNLRKVREIAPEYYDNLISYNSYYDVFYQYIFNPKIGPWSRIKRKIGFKNK